MRIFDNLSIRIKIVSLIVVVSTINVIIVSVLQFYYEKGLYDREIKEKLRILTEVIGESNSATIIFNDQKMGHTYLSALKADKHIKRAIILRPDSSIFTEYKKADKPLAEKHLIPLHADTSIFDKYSLLISRPIIFEGDPIGTIRIDYDLAEYKSKLEQYLYLILATVALSVIIATMLAYLLQTAITRPIFNLYQTINRISFKKDYSLRAKIKGKDEIGKLTQGFNFMIQQTEKQNNELKQAKADSDAALKTKERFLANMTHELRTPLNSIIGLSNLMEDTPLNEEQEEYITNIKTSSDHLLTIINDLLEFSKLGSGKFQLENSEFSIRRIIDRIKRSMEFELNNRKLRFEVNIDKSVPHFVMGDEHRLNQILINLVGNAVKFTPKGSIKIDVKVTSASDTALNTEFKVIDTGIGIAKEKQELIFESFTQESNETTRKYGGTGLGLTITKQLVEIQKGKIWVESEKSKGSTFTFVIPYQMKIPPKAKEDNPKDDFSALKSKKILIVDDNSMNLLFTKSLLEKNGFIAVTCNSGKKAIETLEEESFDLILMDLHMPEMDGFETTKQIRIFGNEQKKNLPIIALTAAATLNEIKKCFDSGMNDYLVKPFKKEELFSKLLSLLLNKSSKEHD